MTWTYVLALLAGGLAFVPLSMLYAHVVRRRRLQEARKAVEAALPAAYPTPEPPSEPTPPRRRRAAQTRERVLVPSTGATYEYTIRRHKSALRQRVADLGGFARIPLLLYDQQGNCVLVHRRLSLN